MGIDSQVCHVISSRLIEEAVNMFSGVFRQYSTSALRKFGGMIRVHSWPPSIGNLEVSSPFISAIPAILRGCKAV